MTDTQIQNETEIAVWLDSYDEMFSDFDPRPYGKRAISDDFVSQVKKVMHGRSELSTTLTLLLPENQRNLQNETIIAERLNNFFKRMLEQLQQERSKNIRKGLLFSFFGIILMIAASFIALQKPEKFMVHLILILFEPAGWFLLWMGLDYLFYFSKSTIKDLTLYRKLTCLNIAFKTY